MQATAHFLFWTIAAADGDRLRARLPDRPQVPRPRLLDHGDPDPDDAVAGGGRQFLGLPLPAADRPVQLRRSRSSPASRRRSSRCSARSTLAPWAIIIVDTWMWTPYVMLICLAGLRSIPDYIYEAAEVDRASAWRQFWSITLPMALPFIMLAVLFRGIENFKMFDMVNLLTGGGPGLDHRGRLDHAEARGLREVAHRLFLGLRDHPVRRGVRPRQHLRQGAQPGEEPMSACAPPAHSVVEPSPLSKRIAGGARRRSTRCITMVPLVWIFADRLQDAAGLDRLSAEGPVRAVARGLLQPVHDALAADAGIHRQPAAADGVCDELARDAQHGDRRPVATTCRASSTR